MKPLLLALAVAFCGNAGAADPPTATTSSRPPALPFRYIGRLVQNGKAEVLLMRGERLYSITAGDKLGEDYVVERIGASSIRFTYLPLNTTQSLDLPGVN
jgi:hypothetical protein